MIDKESGSIFCASRSLSAKILQAAVLPVGHCFPEQLVHPEAILGIPGSWLPDGPDRGRPEWSRSKGMQPVQERGSVSVLPLRQYPGRGRVFSRKEEPIAHELDHGAGRALRKFSAFVRVCCGVHRVLARRPVTETLRTQPAVKWIILEVPEGAGKSPHRHWKS